MGTCAARAVPAAASTSSAPDAGPVPPTFGPGRDWLGTPSRETVQVTDARLDLALDDPADDTATEGARAPYLDVYLGGADDDPAVGPATFTVPTPAAVLVVPAVRPHRWCRIVGVGRALRYR